MRIASITNQGMERDRNEDNCFIKADSNIGLMIVADGMGGHQAGNVASSLAVSIAEVFWDSIDSKKIPASKDARNLVKKMILDANKLILAEANGSPEYYGMGTTMTVGLVCNNRVTIGHIGDSRAYLMNVDKIKLLTEDHTFIEQLIKSGQVKHEEALNHPQRHVLTRALGITENPEIDVFDLEVENGSLLLFCTDGLTTMVSDMEIWSEWVWSEKYEKDDPDFLAKALVDLANSRGGYDNITVVIASDIGGQAEQ